MSSINTLFGKFHALANGVRNKGGTVNVAHNGPSPDEIIAGIATIPQVTISSSVGKHIIVAELPEVTLTLKNSLDVVLSTYTTPSTTGGYHVFDVASAGTYMIVATDAGSNQIWTNTITVDSDGIYNCKVGKVFADYTPAEVNTASKNHYARYMWSVGDSRNITTVGSSKKWVIMGFEHDNKADGTGKAGITLGMQSYTSSTYKHNNTNANNIGWEGSLVRQNGLKDGDVYYTIATVTADTSGTYYTYDEATDAWIQRTLPNDYLADEKYYTQSAMENDGAFVTGIPDWKDYIVPVVKETADAGSAYSKIIKSRDNVFLFSDCEVFGNCNRANSYSRYELEGMQYDYFKNNFSDGKVSLGNYCLLRSPYSGSATYFCYIYTNGCVSCNYASSASYARLGFCL